MINMTSITLPFVLAKFSHRMVIVFGAVMATAGAVGMAFAPNLPLLFFTIIVTYVGASLVHVPGEFEPMKAVSYGHVADFLVKFVMIHIFCAQHNLQFCRGL